MSVGFNKEVTLEKAFTSRKASTGLCGRGEGAFRRQSRKRCIRCRPATPWDIAHKNDLTFRELCALNTNFKGAALNEKSNIREAGDELIVTKQEATLEVRITKIETRQEEIAYTIETTKSNEYTKGTTKVLQEGQNGLRRVTFQNVCTIQTMSSWSRPSSPPRSSRSR